MSDTEQVQILKEIRDQQKEALDIQKQQFEFAKQQYERAERIQDKAEKLQNHATKAFKFIVPLIVILLAIVGYMIYSIL